MILDCVNGWGSVEVFGFFLGELVDVIVKGFFLKCVYCWIVFFIDVCKYFWFDC